MPRSREEAETMADATGLTGVAREAFIGRLTGGAPPAAPAPAPAIPKPPVQRSAPTTKPAPRSAILVTPPAPKPATPVAAAPPKPVVRPAYQMEEQVVVGGRPAQAPPRAATAPPAYVSPTQRLMEGVGPAPTTEASRTSLTVQPKPQAEVQPSSALFGRGSGIVEAARQPVAAAVRRLPDVVEKVAPKMETANPTNPSWESPAGRLLRMVAPEVAPMSQRIAEAERHGQETIDRLSEQAQARQATPVASAFQSLDTNAQAARPPLSPMAQMLHDAQGVKRTDGTGPYKAPPEALSPDVAQRREQVREALGMPGDNGSAPPATAGGPNMPVLDPRSKAAVSLLLTKPGVTNESIYKEYLSPDGKGVVALQRDALMYARGQTR